MHAAKKRWNCAGITWLARLTACSSQDAKRSLWVAEGPTCRCPVPGANEHARASGVEEEAIRTRKMAAGGLCFGSLAPPGEDHNHQRSAVPLSNWEHNVCV